jgi:hypothetical protein
MKRLSCLALLSITTLALSQHQSSTWKEYLYADDGFAITLPSAPTPHKDPANPNINVYTVPLGVDSWLSLRVDHQNRDCAATLAKLKDGALEGKSGIDSSSTKDVSTGGYAGLEYEYRPAANRISSDRFYCVNGHFYAFSVARPISKSRPAALDRIINSFRIVNPAARNFAPLPIGDKRPDAGSVSGQVYRNEFFRFSYTLPEGLKPITSNPEFDRFFDGINSFMLLLAGSTPSSGAGPTSVVRVEAWSQPSLWGEGWREKTGGDYLNRLRTLTNNLEPLGPVKKRMIAGTTFYEGNGKTNSKIPGLPQEFQRNLVRTTEIGYILQFVFEASSREELERLDRSIESINFASQ